MRERLMRLIALVLDRQATDVHLVLQNHHVCAKIRGLYGMEELQSALVDEPLFHYLKYIANLDLGNSDHAQSGSFCLELSGKTLYFRFSFISSYPMQTGVLRILNNHRQIHLCDLNLDAQQKLQFRQWTRQKQGMVILSGPTGSGKTTTLHALLDEIANEQDWKIMTLEDPIEIYDQRFIQLAVNEAQGLTYEEGIKQMMRHDPDVIMIGEIRDTYTAKMAYRCALTGHRVFSTVHAKDALEVLKRLKDLGVDETQLIDTLSAVCAQRLYPKKGDETSRICIFEILAGQDLLTALKGERSIRHATIQDKIRQAVAQDLIAEETAAGDLYSEII